MANPNRSYPSPLAARIGGAETYYPALWRVCYPRSYQASSIYPSPKQLAAELVSVHVGFMEQERMPIHERELTGQAMIGASALISLRVPIFFVAPDLLKAVQMSVPPVDLNWADMHLPFESAAFALPRGSLSHSTYGEVGYVWYSRLAKGEPYSAPPDSYLGTADDDLFLVRGSCMDSQNGPSFQRFLKRSDTPALDLKDFGELVGRKGVGVDADDADIVSAMMTLVFSLAFAMNARKELLERGKPTGKAAKSGLEFWTPNIIGRDYVLGGNKLGAHGGTSPRMHWRRGHMRQQPYGEGRSLRREQWIEPTLIASE